MRIKLVVMVALFAVPVVPIAAQAPVSRGAAIDEARMRVSEALSKGDNATAKKVIADGKAAKFLQGGDTTYEEILSCGFYPQETRLECALAIKRPLGYSGPIGSFGSFEFVAFYVDWHSDGFDDSDYVGSGIVHVTNGSNGTNFAVYRDFNPPGGVRTSNGGGTTQTTTTGPILKARAVLQWSAPIAGPNGVPVWGNVYDFAIRLMPIR
jgi:hypothetical protein